MRNDRAIPAVRASRRSALPLILGLVAVFLVGALYALLFASYLNSHVGQTEDMLRANLKHVVEVARNAMEPILEQVRQGELTREQGLEQVRDLVRRMRYGTDDNYVFMSAYDGTMLVQPIEPEKEGTDQWDIQDPDGVYIIQGLVRTAQENPQGGYFSYRYRSGEGQEPRDKISYVLGIPELSAFVGTGAYVGGLRQARWLLLVKATLLAVAVFVLVALPSGFMLILLRRRNLDLEHEINVRHQVERVMLEGEQRYRALYDNAPIGICQTTPEGRLLRANPAMARMAGFASVREMLEKVQDVTESFYVRAEDRERIVKDLLEKGQVTDGEVLLRGADGQPAWGSLNSRVVTAPDGRVLYIESFIADIDSRRRAEEELRISEERYRLVSVLPDQVVWDSDLITRRVRWVGDVRGVLGFNPPLDGVPLDFWVQRLHPDDQARFLACIQKEWGPSESMQLECRIIKDDGALAHIENRGVILRDEQGRPVRIVGTVRDITRRKEAEDALRRSEATLRAMLTASRDTAVLVDAGGVILAANEEAAKTAGIPLNQMPGKSFYEIMDPAVAEARTQYIKDTARRNEPLWMVEELSGPAYETIYYPVRDDFGRVDRVAVFARDITEQRDAERALHVSERRLRSIFENAPVGIFQSRPLEEFLMVNQEFASMLGYDEAGEILAQILGPHNFMIDADQELAIRDVLFADGEITNEVVPIRRVDGGMAWLLLNAVALRDSWGEVERVEGFVLDMTERVRAEQALKESEAKYRELFESAVDAIFVMDWEIIVDCNQATQILFGLERDRIVGVPVWDLSAPIQQGGRDAVELGQELLQQVYSGQPQRFGWVHKHSDGRLLHAEVSLTRIEVAGEQRLLAVIHDVTERLRAEEQRSWFERIASASNDQMTFVDMDMTYLAANDAYAEALGTTVQEILGRTVPEAFGPEAWETIREYMERCRNGELITYSLWLSLPGLGRRYTETACFPYHDETGSQTGMVVNRRDITHRKRIQDALLESERRYRLLAENAADVIWLMDQNLRLTYISPAVEGFVGRTSREVLQRPQERFFSAASWVELEKALRDLAEDRRGTRVPAPSRRLEFSFLHKDGRELWAEVVVTAIRGSDGELEGFQGVARDITERKQAREALARSLRFEKVVDLCAKKLLSAGSEGDVLEGVLQEVLRAAGVGRTYVFMNFEDPELGLCCRQIHEVCAPGVEPQIDNPDMQHAPYESMAPFFLARLEQGREVSGLVKDIPEPERSMLEAQGIRSFLVLPLVVGGSWQGFLGFDDVFSERVWEHSERLFLQTTADIVGAHFERLRAEQDLLQAYAELDQIFNSSGNGMALFDSDGTVLRVNKPFLEMFDLPSDGVLGRKCHEVVPEECGRRGICPARTTLGGGAHEGYEFFLEDGEGGKRWFVVSASPFLNAQGELSGTVVTYRDTTRLKQAQLESMQRQEQLIQADKLASLGTLVSGVAHEINNPNGIIALNAPTLAAIWQGVRPVLENCYRGEGDFKVGEFSYSQVRGEVDYLFEQVIESGRRIKHIVAELKNFARQEVADMSQVVDLAEVVRAAVGLVFNKIKKSTARFDMKLPSRPVEVRGNFQRLEQVLVNVLINACEALNDTGQAMNVFLERDSNSGQALVKVRDEGLGISGEDMKHIFDPFFTTKRDSGGTGLGLSVSHGIIQEHGGTMEYQSEPGKGTLCVIRLPLADAPAAGKEVQ